MVFLFYLLMLLATPEIFAMDKNSKEASIPSIKGLSDDATKVLTGAFGDGTAVLWDISDRRNPRVLNTGSIDTCSMDVTSIIWELKDSNTLLEEARASGSNAGSNAIKIRYIASLLHRFINLGHPKNVRSVLDYLIDRDER